ncbi:MAG: YlxR family protein [Lachnospiraceae bacterium]|nr:YlxR family protein [Lachnospiraceae bacterium]
MAERKAPLRTCAGCRGVKEKSGLIRIVRTPEGVVRADFTGRAAGRGTYLCPQISCLETALKKGGIARSLHVTLTSEQTEKLRRELQEFEERDP